MVLCLSFDRGSLLVRGQDPSGVAGLSELRTMVPEARDDDRVGAMRVSAHQYHLVVRTLTARALAYDDKARAYGVLDLPAPAVAPRDYQRDAVAAWRAAGRRGVVVLPTGSGKTVVAALAIAETARSTLVVVPTLDLLHQWYDMLATTFGAERVGAVGGGEHRPAPLTVTTYDSAYLHLDRLGDRFGLVVWDEAHHLAAPSAIQSARMALAPFSLGLTATPIEDERAGPLVDVAGPIVFRREIVDLAGDFLSPYEVVRLKVRLSPAERAAYDAASKRYRDFLVARGIRLGGQHGWRRFLEQTSRSPEGRAAFAAWREQRRLALAAPRKLETLDGILRRHARDRVIVFTNQNDAAYEVSRRFLVPAITHQTRPAERRATLAGLRDGTLPVVVTSRVLNEGVDVPSVGVGVVLSGTATVREHVQRLGRILRKVEGKRAVLYEVVTEGTTEEAASARRRDHDAYR
jgi:superfamily II DNA or RNA helicase